eukprot:TRINITY_DN1532_c0_g1_i1.p1 TRINITY_DN1532_c0_g1~~TRINITY_DN1532_c0_g1_i1.p1  ORF type:complete len:483 (-),score=77.35 TRINITY_DN1532_c0_g1_i1:1530-2978(-)
MLHSPTLHYQEAQLRFTINKPRNQMEERKIYAHELDEDDDLGAQNIIATDEGLEQEEPQPMEEPESPPSEQSEEGRELEILNDMLQEDPHNASLYQQIIEHYKRLGRSEMVHKTRTQAVEWTTLSLEMWKDWLEDAKLEASTFHERVKIGEIYELALDSFNYYEIAKGYAEHVSGLYFDPENDGTVSLNEVKKVFDKILRVWLLDFSHSTEIWQMYLEIELNAYDSAESEEEKAQKERVIRGLYRQKLSFPTIDLDLIWDDYQTWEKDETRIEEMKQKYVKSSEKVQNMIKFEDNLAGFIKDFELTNGTFCTQIPIDISPLVEYYEKELPGIAGDNFNYYELYIERVLSKYPDQEKLWDYYIKCTEVCKNNALKIRVYQRACKNCKQNVGFKILLLRENEKSGAPPEKYEELIEKFLEEIVGEVQLEHFLRKELCEYLARHVQKEDTDLIEKMRKVYLESMQHILPCNLKAILDFLRQQRGS